MSPASATKEPPKSSDLGGFSTSREHWGFEPNCFDPILTPIRVLESLKNMEKWGEWKLKIRVHKRIGNYLRKMFQNWSSFLFNQKHYEDNQENIDKKSIKIIKTIQNWRSKVNIHPSKVNLQSFPNGFAMQ